MIKICILSKYILVQLETTLKTSNENRGRKILNHETRKYQNERFRDKTNV